MNRTINIPPRANPNDVMIPSTIAPASRMPCLPVQTLRTSEEDSPLAAEFGQAIAKPRRLTGSELAHLREALDRCEQLRVAVGMHRTRIKLCDDVVKKIRLCVTEYGNSGEHLIEVLGQGAQLVAARAFLQDILDSEATKLETLRKEIIAFVS